VALERLGRRTVNLPFPVVVALLVVGSLVVGSAGCVFLWKALSKGPDEGSPVGATPAERTAPPEHPAPTTTATPAAPERTGAVVSPQPERVVGNLPSIPHTLPPATPAKAKSAKDKGKKGKKDD
jgi:hypothetical protein